MPEERQQAREKIHRLGQELFELSEQIKASEGHRMQLKFRALRSSYYVSEGNYRRTRGPNLPEILNFKYVLSPSY